MRIGVTVGDPSGVGPDLVARALAEPGAEELVVFGDLALLERAAARQGLPPPGRSGAKIEGGRVDAVPGRPTAEGAKAQLAWLEAAASAARRGAIDALVTGPIHKASARAAGFAFPGQTEMLAERLGVRTPAMMLAGPRLRVVPVTTHIALAEVPRTLSADKIARVCALTVQSLVDDLGVERPRVAVAGLNPHAGEQGLFGDEEARLIAPAVEAVADGPLKERYGFTLTGPHVPDVVFRAAAQPPAGEGRFDAVVAMYHDQALIPLKLLDFDEGVNLTLGLPVPRTSPDHGVAYDVAGTERVRHGSFRAALVLARQVAARRALRRSNP